MLSTVQAKLLIVDDLPENLLALEALIKREDRQVYKALSADEALSLLLEHEFAMAILDVQMPGMNGFELAELMRGTEKTKNIPIVFVSAAGRELNYAFKGYESGAVDFLHKPLDIHAVKSKVNVFVDLYRQSKAMKQQVEALEQSRREQEALLTRLQATQAELEQAVRMRDDFKAVVAQIELLEKRGKAEQARQMLARQLEAHPDSAYLQHALGIWLLNHGQTEYALLGLAKAVELEPDNSDYRYKLATALHDLDQLEAAQRQLEELLQRQPANRKARVLLIGYWKEAGQLQNVQVLLAQLEQMNPDDPSLQQGL